MILSASRRTDIPAYYSEWFMNRLKAGYVLSKNPMNPNQIRRIELTPELIDCIVFWSKDPYPMMESLPLLEKMGYHYYFQFTLTPYGKDIERNLRDKKDIVDTFIQLSDRIGKDRIIWRYDPIIINDEITEEYHIDHFKRLCSQLQGYTKVCMISFIDIYAKLAKSVKSGIIKEISEQEMRNISEAFLEIARSYGIEVRACCEPAVLNETGIHPMACVDRELIEQICGHSIRSNTDKNQRAGCRCVQSVDIGIYNTCKNGCVYCYANHSDTSIDKNCSRHDPGSDILIDSVR